MALFNMSPCASGANTIHRAFSDFKFESDGARRSGIVANVANEIVVKLAGSAAHSAWLYVMQYGIGSIFDLRPPSKVIKTIVMASAVRVTRVVIMARSRATKGFQNHNVDRAHLGCAFKRKIDSLVPVQERRNADSRLDLPLTTAFGIDKARDGANPAEITNFVSRFVSKNRTPLLLHIQSPITKAPCGSVWRQHGILMFGSYPSHTNGLYA